jgi:uncharacterized protein (TIGR02246 family)
MDEVLEAMVDGFNAGDASALASLYAEDADAGDLSGQIHKGKAAIQGVWSGTLNAFKGGTMRIGRTGLHVVSPDVVVVDARWEITGGTVPEGHATAGFVTLVVAKQGDAWPIVSSRAKIPPSS